MIGAIIGGLVELACVGVGLSAAADGIASVAQASASYDAAKAVEDGDHEKENKENV